VLSPRTNLDPARAVGQTASYALRVGDLDLHARLVDGTFRHRAGLSAPDATLAGPLETLVGLVYDGHDLDDAVRTGELSVTGDEDAARRFLTLFTLFEKVAPAPANDL